MCWYQWSYTRLSRQIILYQYGWFASKWHAWEQRETGNLYRLCTFTFYFYFKYFWKIIILFTQVVLKLTTSTFTRVQNQSNLVTTDLSVFLHRELNELEKGRPNQVKSCAMVQNFALFCLYNTGLNKVTLGFFRLYWLMAWSLK